MAANKKSFYLFNDYEKVFEMLTDEEAGQLIKHLFAYVNERDTKIENRLLKMAFEPIRLQLERAKLKYEAICRRNKENGLKGGRPPKENPKNPLGYLETQINPLEPKKADTDTDTDTDTDNISIESDWRKSFELYQEYVRDGYQEAISDLEWVKKQEEYNPNIDIAKSIEKSCTNFWITEEGWLNKKKSKSKTINWKTTFANAISNSINKVYKNNNANEEKRKYHQF